MLTDINNTRLRLIHKLHSDEMLLKNLYALMDSDHDHDETCQACFEATQTIDKIKHDQHQTLKQLL